MKTDAAKAPLETGPRDRAERAAIIAIMLAACLALLFTAPTDGNFFWSDAPRHALNGAFVKDLVEAFPWRDPKGWAIDYYLRYPALTILFYPPLFYFFEAAAFALFGVSHFVAQATVILFTFALAASSYGLARMALPRWSSLAVALLAIGAPEVAFWGRQVMLDIPAYGALVSGVYFFARYIRDGQRRWVYFAVLAVLAAVYIKLNAIFIAPVFLLVLLIAKGPKALLAPEVIKALILGAIGILPAIFLVLRFGGANVESVSGRPGDIARSSLDAWLFYGKLLPDYIGYAGLVLAVCGAVLVALRRAGPKERWFAWLLLGWFVIDYVFVSAIGVREARHGLMMQLPLALCAVYALHYFLNARLAQGVAMVLGIATLGYSLFFYPVPAVDGYRAVADYVARNAPKNAIVVFSGYRDGNFVFNLRTHEERRDIATIRSDKILLRVRVERARGVTQTDYDEAKISDILRQAGVNLIVYQPGFWEDLQEMKRFADIVHSSAYQRVARFDIGGPPGRSDKAIEIYRPTHPVARRQNNLLIDMPIIGDQFNGHLGDAPAQ